MVERREHSHLTDVISGIWRIHPYGEDNTRVQRYHDMTWQTSARKIGKSLQPAKRDNASAHARPPRPEKRKRNGRWMVKGNLN